MDLKKNKKTKHFSLAFFFFNKKKLLFLALSGPFQCEVVKNVQFILCVSSNIFLISIFFLFFSTLLFWVSDLLHPSSVSLGLSYIVSFPIFSIYFIWQCQILIVALRAFDLHVGSSSPKRRTNPGPLHWGYGILATRPPGKSS